MYKIVSRINDTTYIAIKDNTIFILKKIDIADAQMYKAILNIDSNRVAHHYGFTTVDENMYVVVEYINGITLEQYCSQNYPLSNDRIIEIATGICDGLSAIHSAGLVHRDITPTNIIIDNNGNPVIIDFDISRFSKPDQPKDTQILGTFGFAAPEQYGFSQTSKKADIYSMGVLINYMTTLKMPNEELSNGRLAPIIKKCIQIDENKRYDNIEELSHALHRNNVEGIIRSVPGFRSGKGWHIVIAGIYYAMLPLIFYVLVESSKNLISGLCNFAVGIFIFVLPVPLVTNYKNWINRWSLTKTLPKSGKIAVQVISVIACLIISCMLIVASEI